MANADQRLFVESEEGLRLKAAQCARCEYVDFPAQYYGCRNCGSYGDDLREVQIPTDGRIVTSAAVQHHSSEAYRVPYVVAVVTLDSGPVTRVVMRDVSQVSIGDQVEGAVTDGDAGETEIRFVSKESINA